MSTHMNSELHLTRKDFKVEWFSGQGAGGQHRNKHQNCCRITHIETGLTGVGQNSRSRVQNQRDAFTILVSKLLAHYFTVDTKDRYNATEVIRTYHAERNEVHDKASGVKLPFKDVIEKKSLGTLIEERRKTFS